MRVEGEVLQEGGRRWYVAQTLPHREFGAQLQLEKQGFPVFLPVIARTVRHARKLRNVRAPLFPRYLFVDVDVTRARWRAINGTFGVSGLIMAHDRPAPVPFGVVEELMACADESGMVNKAAGLQVGDKVRVLNGPFAECLGELERLDGKDRVRVLLEIMGGQVPILLGRGQLTAA